MCNHHTTRRCVRRWQRLGYHAVPLILSQLFVTAIASAQDAGEDPYAPIQVSSSQQTQTAEPSNLMNPNVSLVGNFLAAYTAGETPVGSIETTALGLQEIELGFQAAVDPYFRVDAFLAIEGNGPTIEAEQLELTSLCLPSGLQVQLGQLLAEFGRQNTRHLETWDFADNHLPNELVFNGGLSAPGLELSYLVPTGGRTLMLKLFGQALDARSDGMTALTGADVGIGDGHENLAFDELRLAALGRLEAALTLSPSWTLVLGSSVLAGPSGEREAELDSSLLGLDIYLRYRQTRGRGITTVSLATEGVRRKRELQGQTFEDYGASGVLFWRFAQRWNTAARFDWTDGDGVLDVRRGSASLSFLPSEFSRLRLQYSAHQPEHESDLGHTALLQVEFSIGPHGAHAF